MAISNSNPALAQVTPVPGSPIGTMIASDVTSESPYRITEASEARDTEAGEIVEID